MIGKIVSPGDADDNEKPGGAFGTSFQDRHSWFGSPTINLRTAGDGVYNDQGIDTDIADAIGDIKIVYELYTGGVKGNVNATSSSSRPRLPDRQRTVSTCGRYPHPRR